MKELLEKPIEELIDMTRDVYSLGAEVYNFFADKMGLIIATFEQLSI